MVTAALESPVHVPRELDTVRQCYSLFDAFFPACGLLDYTEGIYDGDPSVPYETAQQRQIDYVLDQVNCGPDVRLLEVGSGNGTLLAAAKRRGASITGVTISPEQVRLCKSKGLDARLLNYEELGAEWERQFDAVIANGPIEHFVQARDAAAGKTDAIYTRMFSLFRRLLHPASPVKRLINTTIHFLRPPQPQDLLRHPFHFPWGSDRFHWAFLNRSFGGFYPVLGQFERCAAGSFRLIHTVDGTHDYHLTSEEWLRRIRRVLPTGLGLKILGSAIPFAVRHPAQFVNMLTCMLVSQSWNWQFRGPNPPTCLLRQTWEAV